VRPALTACSWHAAPRAACRQTCEAERRTCSCHGASSARRSRAAPGKRTDRAARHVRGPAPSSRRTSQHERVRPRPACFDPNPTLQPARSVGGRACRHHGLVPRQPVLRRQLGLQRGHLRAQRGAGEARPRPAVRQSRCVAVGRSPACSGRDRGEHGYNWLRFCTSKLTSGQVHAGAPQRRTSSGRPWHGPYADTRASGTSAAAASSAAAGGAQCTTPVGASSMSLLGSRREHCLRSSQEGEAEQPGVRHVAVLCRAVCAPCARERTSLAPAMSCLVFTMTGASVACTRSDTCARQRIQRSHELVHSRAGASAERIGCAHHTSGAPALAVHLRLRWCLQSKKAWCFPLLQRTCSGGADGTWPCAFHKQHTSCRRCVWLCIPSRRWAQLSACSLSSPSTKDLFHDLLFQHTNACTDSFSYIFICNILLQQSLSGFGRRAAGPVRPSG